MDLGSRLLFTYICRLLTLQDAILHQPYLLHVEKDWVEFSAVHNLFNKGFNLSVSFMAMDFLTVNYFRKKAPSWMFEGALNTTLRGVVEIQSSI